MFNSFTELVRPLIPPRWFRIDLYAILNQYENNLKSILTHWICREQTKITLVQDNQTWCLSTPTEKRYTILFSQYSLNDRFSKKISGQRDTSADSNPIECDRLDVIRLFFSITIRRRQSCFVENVYVHWPKPKNVRKFCKKKKQYCPGLSTAKVFEHLSTRPCTRCTVRVQYRCG